MTKDEFNEILKEDGMCLSVVYDGTLNNVFYVIKEGDTVVKFNGADFIFSLDYSQGYGKKIVAALIEYVNTPIKERKPKPQLYNIIIAQDTVPDRHLFTVWRKVGKLGEYSVNSCIEQHDLLHNDDFKFTVEEVEDLKSKVSEKQKQSIDIGRVKVGEKMPTRVDTTEGYEVDKEIEKYVKFKGLDRSIGYLNYDVTFEKFFVDTIRPDSDTKIKFTESWLKDNWSEYEAYNNAGLLEFEEVEDDE